MRVAQLITEAPASLRWRRGALITWLVYRHSFKQLGRGSVIVRPKVLRGTHLIEVGKDCAFYEGCWLAVEAHFGPLIIGDHNYFGHDVHLHAWDPITIGSDCVFADGVFVGSSDHQRQDPHQSHGTGPITIGDQVFVGQRATILGGVTIADGATVGAHAVVTKDVAPGQTVVGVPARPLLERP
jgi:acetyltransferase-like isoleucine patch superfamily enzyme